MDGAATKLVKEKSHAIRIAILETLNDSKPGHLGGSSSCVDLIAALYFYKMRHDPKRPSWEERDRFILSKGHASLAQYAALAEAGYFDKSELATFKDLGSKFQGHPEKGKVAGVEASTGSLGQGLSVGLGMALAAKLSKKDYRVYVLLGDGELQEGQVWEAAMAAAHYKLDNLIAIVDRNNLQVDGEVEQVLHLEPLLDKWTAFGWDSMIIDGHDIEKICHALDSAAKSTEKPKVIIANTIKGKDFSFAENNVSYHNCQLTPEQYQRAKEQLLGKEVK
jgi:transketolase